MSCYRTGKRMMILAIFKPVIIPKRVVIPNGLVVNNFSLFSHIFDENIDENLGGILHGLTKTFFFSFLEIPKIF